MEETNRFDSKTLYPGQAEDDQKVRKLFAEIASVLYNYDDTREMAIAFTQLETAQMWTTKAISRSPHL